MPNDRVAVLGAGSWGTTLANMLALKGCSVKLWARESEVVAAINNDKENPLFLPGIPLSPDLKAVADVATTVADAEVVLSVVPTQHVRRILNEARPALPPDAIFISASKGIEVSTLATVAGIVARTLPRALSVPSCYISGPSFASEVARRQPTAVTLASRVESSAERAQALFQTDYFRVYTTRDVVGVELAGALKNVIALATGMAVGLDLGHNARAALISRGLAEIRRLGVSLGADPLTFSGLAGMGDLILTCTGDLSRNRAVGIALGQGKPLDSILQDMKMVAEGVQTTKAALALSRREGIEMPIVEEVHAVLFDGRDAGVAVENLMLRGPKAELQ